MPLIIGKVIAGRQGNAETDALYCVHAQRRPSAALLSRLNAHYEEPNRELAELLDEDLSAWSAHASTTK